MPSRRVRQIERKGPERRREFVQDVTGSVDEEKNDESSFAAGASS